MSDHRECEFCGTSFLVKSLRSRFCSKNCMKYAWNRKNDYDSSLELSKWKKQNKDHVNEKQQQYRIYNKIELAEKSKIWQEINKEKLIIQRKNYRIDNADSIKQLNKKWKTKNKKHILSQANLRYKNDFNFRMKAVLRARLRSAIKNNTKTGSAVKDLGCSIEELKKHIESKFTEGMSWENWGKGNNKWNIDHIIPLASFDLSNREELIKAVHYSNLQPLWEPENNRKGSRYVKQ